MDPRPPKVLLLLTSLLHFWQCVRGQSSYIIDNVGLTILPRNTIQSGNSVTLRCQVGVSHDNIPNLTHTFQFTRDDILVHALTTTDDTVEYELNPARAADSGSYECRVAVRGRSKASNGQRLDVTGLQTPVLYLNKTSPYESEEFTATCSAQDEKGTLTFRFYQRLGNGTSKMIKQKAPTANWSETELALSKAGSSFIYCDYEINLVSGLRRSNPSNEIQVRVKSLNISPTVNVLPSLSVYEGDVIEVGCKVENTLKDVEVFLTKDKRILQRAPVSLNHRLTMQMEDSGEFVCKAVWNNVQKETNVSVTVKELFSKPSLTLEPTDLFERDRFMLNCSVTIKVPESVYIKTMQFSIYNNNIKVMNGNTFDAFADPRKNGNYSCKVLTASFTHKIVKESNTIVVKAKVPVSKPVLSVVGGTVVLGKPFQLLCHSINGTLPIDYTLNGPNKLRELKVVSKSEEPAIFNCSAIYKSSDLNKFSCHASNSQKRRAEVGSGQQLLQTTNIIEPVSEPWLVTIPSGEDISEGQDMTLSCSIQRGTPPISFNWYNMKRVNLGSQISSQLEESIKINNVQGKHQGGYYCESTNSANETKRSRVVIVVVKLAGWKKGLIAVFLLLLLLAVTLVIVFRKNILRFKRKRTAELSVKSVGIKAERLSLTQAEVNGTPNGTPGIMGKSVWSEHVSGSESDDQNSLTYPEKQETRYTEVPPETPDHNRDLEKNNTESAQNEVCKSTPDVPEQADGQGSVEYAQLNHDAQQHSDITNPGEHGVQDEHTHQNENNTADQEESQPEPLPDS